MRESLPGACISSEVPHKKIDRRLEMARIRVNLVQGADLFLMSPKELSVHGLQSRIRDNLGHGKNSMLQFQDMKGK